MICEICKKKMILKNVKFKYRCKSLKQKIKIYLFELKKQFNKFQISK